MRIMPHGTGGYKTFHVRMLDSRRQKKSTINEEILETRQRRNDRRNVIWQQGNRKSKRHARQNVEKKTSRIKEYKRPKTE